MIELIVLCGGLGTRLQSAVPDHPKSLAPIDGRPFLTHFLAHLFKSSSVHKIIFALGHRFEVVLDYLEQHPLPIPWDYTIETEPLGTGGAARLAIQKVTSKHVMVMNGDTIAPVRLDDFLAFHQRKKARVSIALTKVEETSRYGNVRLNDKTHEIVAFCEKETKAAQGWISAGVYCLDVSAFSKTRVLKNFSIEYDLFPKFVKKGLYGYPSKGFFIDIGTKESYARAQSLQVWGDGFKKE